MPFSCPNTDCLSEATFTKKQQLACRGRCPECACYLTRERLSEEEVAEIALAKLDRPVLPQCLCWQRGVGKLKCPRHALETRVQQNKFISARSRFSQPSNQAALAKGKIAPVVANTPPSEEKENSPSVVEDKTTFVESKTRVAEPLQKQAEKPVDLHSVVELQTTPEKVTISNRYVSSHHYIPQPARYTPRRATIVRQEDIQGVLERKFFRLKALIIKARRQIAAMEAEAHAATTSPSGGLPGRKRHVRALQKRLHKSKRVVRKKQKRNATKGAQLDNVQEQPAPLAIFQRPCPNGQEEDIPDGPHEPMGFARGWRAGRVCASLAHIMEDVRFSPAVREILQSLSNLWEKGGHISVASMPLSVEIVEILAKLIKYVPDGHMYESLVLLNFSKDGENRLLRDNLKADLEKFQSLGTHALAHGFPVCITNLAKTVGEKLKNLSQVPVTATQAIIEFVFNEIKKQVMNTIRSYLPAITDFKATIDNFWNSCRRWALNMYSTMQLHMQVLSTATLWTCAFVLASCLIRMLESLLHSLGFLNVSGVLNGGFLIVLLGYLGYSTFSCEKVAKLRDILLVAVEQLVGTNKPANDGEDVLHTDAHSSPFGTFTILTTIGSALHNASFGTTKYLADWGRMLHALRQGKDVLKDVLGFLCDRFSEVYSWFTGEDAELFRAIKALTKFDIEVWQKDCQLILRRAAIVQRCDRATLIMIDRLKSQGHEFMRNVDATQGKMSAVMSRYIMSLLEKIDKIYEEFAKSGGAEDRSEPFWVYLWGESRCGKSLALSSITPRLLEEAGYPTDSIACKTQTDKYFQNYYRQRAVQIDDISSTVVKGGTNLEPEMIQIGSCATYMVAKADIGGKETVFDSEIIVSTSNFFTAPSESGVRDYEAYQNRRAIVVKCRRAPGVAYDPHLPHAALQCIFQDSHTEEPRNIKYIKNPDALVIDRAAGTVEPEEWGPYEEKLEQIVEWFHQFREHRQVELKRRVGNRYRGSELYKAAGAYLHELVDGVVIVPNVEHLTHRVDGRLCAIDGVVYEIDPRNIAIVNTKNSRTVARQLEEHTINGMPKRILSNLSGQTVHSLEVMFLRGMIDGVAHVRAVDQYETPHSSHKEFFDMLPLAERVFLRVVQRCIDNTDGSPVGIGEQSWLNQLRENLKSVYDQVWEGKGKLVLILLAFVLLSVTFFKFFSVLKTVCTSAGFGMFAAFAKMDAHSVFSSSAAENRTYISRSQGSSYRHVMAHGGEDEIFSDEYCTDMLVRIDVVGKQIVSAMRFKGRSLVLTNHQAVSIPHNSTVYITYTNKKQKGQTLTHMWNHRNIESFQGSELVVYRSNELSPLPSTHESRFLMEVESLPRQFEIHGSVIKLKSYFKTGLDAAAGLCDDDTPLLAHWKSIGSVATEKQVITTTVNGLPYTRDVSRYIRSNCPTSYNDCGAIISIMYEGRRRIIGLHVAGTTSVYKGQTTCISTACFLPNVSYVEAHSNMPQYVPETGLSAPGIDKLGFISDVSLRPHIVTKTQLVKVPKEYEIPSEVTKEPSILTKDDVRLKGKKYDPMVQGMEKFSQPMQPLDQSILSEVCDDIVESWFDCSPDLEDVSDDVVINGTDGEDFLDPLVMSTSEGYPYVLSRKVGEKGKSRFFVPAEDGKLELLAGTAVAIDYERLKEEAAVHVPELICMELPKDECLPLRKIYDTPGTRLFSCLPLPFNMLLRKKYLAFCQFIQSNRHKLSTQVGVNPYSREWQALYSRLAEKNDHALNCDYSKFDGLMSFQVLDMISEMINKVYKDSVSSKRVRKNLLLAIYNRKSISGSQVFEVRAGIPSGCALTVLLNSVFNEILIRYVYKTVVPSPERDYFSKHVALIIYGDDNLISISPHIASQFSGAVIKERLKRFGITITDGSDKTSDRLEAKPLQNLDFLKRGFKELSTGLVVAPLDKNSIYSSLQYVTTGGGDVLVALRQNVEGALRELWLHQDENEFRKVRNFFAEKCQYRDLPTWAYYASWHMTQLSGKNIYAPHRYFEVQPADKGIKPILWAQASAGTVTGFGDRLCVATLGYKPQPNDYIVSIGDRLANGVEGYSKPVEIAYGSGAMATDKWARSCANMPKVQEAYHEGKNLVFVDRQPALNAIVALVHCSRGLGLDWRQKLAFFREHKPPGANDLSSYFEKNKCYVKRSQADPFVIPPGDTWRHN